jgi:hypothetical protein
LGNRNLPVSPQPAPSRSVEKRANSRSQLAVGWLLRRRPQTSCERPPAIAWQRSCSNRNGRSTPAPRLGLVSHDQPNRGDG